MFFLSLTSFPRILIPWISSLQECPEACCCDDNQMLLLLQCMYKKKNISLWQCDSHVLEGIPHATGIVTHVYVVSVSR